MFETAVYRPGDYCRARFVCKLQVQGRESEVKSPAFFGRPGAYAVFGLAWWSPLIGAGVSGTGDKSDKSRAGW